MAHTNSEVNGPSSQAAAFNIFLGVSAHNLTMIDVRRAGGLITSVTIFERSQLIIA